MFKGEQDMKNQEKEIAKMIQMVADKTGLSYSEAAEQVETFMSDFLNGVAA